MRITNKMMTTNMQNNIARNKSNMSVIGNQYATGQKIQRPSEDPVVAVRSLKYRTQLSELTQYYEKNIPDALNWMDITESALDGTNEVLTYMSKYCDQGANGTLNTDNRNSIIETLKEYRDQIYEEYGNTDYSGRYVFTGYRTDTPLLFGEASSNLKYTIKENFSKTDLSALSYVYNEIDYEVGKTAPQYAADAPTMKETHRLRLAYDNLDSGAGSFKSLNFSVKDAATGNVTETVINSTGTTVTTRDSSGAVIGAPVTGTFTLNTISSTNKEAYNVGDNAVNFIPETGELILGTNVYNAMQNASSISTEYDKTNFEKGDVQPMHYFECKSENLTTGKVINYDAPGDQNIQYEVNFSQKLTVNTLASNSISTNIGRTVDEIVAAAKEVEASELKLKEVEKMIADSANAGNLDALNELKSQLETEIALKNKVMQSSFGKGLTMISEEQDRLNVAIADHGSRYVRLELTEARLSDQQVDFKEIQNKNDTVNIEDVIIDYNAADVTYNASLAAAAKVVTNTLLDFL